MNTAGVVLCGGRSTRMGQPKALLPFGDELLLQRMVRIVGAVVPHVIVVAAVDQELPPLPGGVQFARDDQPGRGPLQGLAAGLQTLAGIADIAYVCSCDAPLLRPAFVRLMLERVHGYSIAVPDVGGYRHPLAAAYRVDVLPVVRQLLAEDRLRPAYLFDLVPTRLVRQEELVEVDPTLDSLRNLNTPEEYAAALRDYQALASTVGNE